MMTRVRKAAFVAVALATLVGAAPSAQAATKTYRPPFRVGPEEPGGSLVFGPYSDRTQGQMGMLLVCTPGARPGYNAFRVQHTVASKKIASVTVNFDGGVDAFSSIFVEMFTTRYKKLGSAVLKGPNGALGGKLVMKPKAQPKKGTKVIIQFGLRGTSCPAASLSGARFNSVAVKY